MAHGLYMLIKCQRLMFLLYDRVSRRTGSVDNWQLVSKELQRLNLKKEYVNNDHTAENLKQSKNNTEKEPKN